MAYSAVPGGGKPGVPFRPRNAVPVPRKGPKRPKRPENDEERAAMEQWKADKRRKAEERYARQEADRIQTEKERAKEEKDKRGPKDDKLGGGEKGPQP